MKNAYMVFVIMLYTCCANATTVCARNDVVTIGLKATEQPTSVAYDNDKFEWRAYYKDFGTVTGVASCSPINSGDCPSPWYWGFGCPFAASGTDPDSNFQGRKDGRYCWCKVTHPFESKWVTMWLYGAVCVENCAAACANRFNHNTPSDDLPYKRRLFMTVAMDE